MDERSCSLVEAAALVGAADALLAATGGLAGLRSGWCGLQRWSVYARCENECLVLLTCGPGPDSNWRKPPEGNRGRDDGISVPWKFVNDDVLSGKMLVECYLAEDSCMRDKERERKRKRWWYPGKHLRRPPEKAAAGATAFSQYSTTAPTTVWPQVPCRRKSYLHIVVVQIWAGVGGEQRKSTW